MFISYRRTGSAAAAGRLYDTLSARFGEKNVFMDVATIEPGQEFPEEIARTVQRCQAFVVVIGPTWLEQRAPDGNRRIDDPDDYVRFEIERAIASGRPIFPVLVDGATMPGAQELPPSLRPLARRQALEISATRYRYDTELLVNALENAAARTGPGPSGPIPAPRADPPVNGPAERAPTDHGTEGPGTSGGRVPPGRRTPRARLIRWSLLGGLLLVTAVAVTWAVTGGTPRWGELAPAPRAFEGAGVAEFEGRLWVAGGVSPAEGPPDVGRPHLDTVSVYDPATGAWTAGPPLPAPVAFAPLVAADGELYLVGGQLRDGPDERGPVATVLRLDEGSGTWVEETPLPEARARGAAAWDGDRIVYAGGVGADLAASDAVYALENGAWRQIGRLSVAREKLAAATDGFGRVWFMGGRNTQTPDPAYGAVDVVQTTDEIFVAGPIAPVHSAGAVWHAGTGPCVVGGDTGAGVTADVECLAGESGIPPLPQARAGIGAEILGDRLHVVGGYGSGFHGTAAFQVLRMDLG